MPGRQCSTQRIQWELLAVKMGGVTIAGRPWLKGVVSEWIWQGRGALQVRDGVASQGHMGTQHVAAGRWLQLHGAPGERGVGEWTQGRPHPRGLEVTLEGSSGCPEAGALPGVLPWPDQLVGLCGDSTLVLSL